MAWAGSLGGGGGGGGWGSSKESAEELNDGTKPEEAKSVDDFCCQILSQGQSQFKTNPMEALNLHEPTTWQSLLFCLLYAKDPQMIQIVTW